VDYGLMQQLALTMCLRRVEKGLCSKLTLMQGTLNAYEASMQTQSLYLYTRTAQGFGALTSLPSINFL